MAAFCTHNGKYFKVAFSALKYFAFIYLFIFILLGFHGPHLETHRCQSADGNRNLFISKLKATSVSKQRESFMLKRHQLPKHY